MKRCKKVVHRWLQHLPYLLLQLKDGSPALTEVVLGILKKTLTQSLLKADREVFLSLWVFFCKCLGCSILLSTPRLPFCGKHSLSLIDILKDD